MKMTVYVSGDLSSEDVQKMQDASASLFGPDTELVFQKKSKQIDASVLVVTCQLVAAVAALLHIYIHGSRLVAGKLTYDRLIEEIRVAMAKKGVQEIEILDIANFKPKAARGLDDPCVVTVRDREGGSCYKVFYSGKDDVFAVEIQKAG